MPWISLSVLLFVMALFELDIRTFLIVILIGLCYGKSCARNFYWKNITKFDEIRLELYPCSVYRSWPAAISSTKICLFHSHVWSLCNQLIENDLKFCEEEIGGYRWVNCSCYTKKKERRSCVNANSDTLQCTYMHWTFVDNNPHVRVCAAAGW